MREEGLLETKEIMLEMLMTRTTQRDHHAQLQKPVVTPYQITVSALPCVVFLLIPNKNVSSAQYFLLLISLGFTLQSDYVFPS